ncbi:AraC family transcriptional regulator [Aromatoleum petrolei]|uniref:Helix-turn-helix domain-containing protein n=1 Tax=Aromatoleum petrolei TaxID=76116 RepID=A0ABX1MPR8_9RHOO|nr:AraC family transcriptional regulator [Aromatoleum petrolei]NMF89915.1 helix-turn-helix domain-containing protein [Aromatoleum petrolei]QTQ34444.1 Transcriptional regulator, AraC family [Aromatoleum petrolei]
MTPTEISAGTVPMSFVLNLLGGTPPDAQAEALARAGIAPVLLEAETARVTTEQFATLYRQLARQLDDELPGMFSRPVRSGSLKFLCLSLMDSATLQTALFRFTRFFHLVLDDFGIELSRQGELIRMALIPQAPQAAANTFGQEIMLKLIHGVASWLTGHRMTLARVDCSYPRPSHASEYGFLYPGPVSFEQPVSALYFEASQLATPIRQDRRSLAQFLARAPGDWMFVAFEKHPTSQKVREHLRPRLSHPITAAQTASALHLSLRTLTRRLAAEGTTFQAIKDELRRDAAIQLLTKTDTPIAVIGQEIGFEDPNTFHRAFRKWTGSTPGAYRPK